MKYTFYIILFLSAVAIGWFANENLTQQVNLTIGDTTIVYIDTMKVNRTITIVQLPPHTVEIVQLYMDSVNNEHQVYVDSVQTDSISFTTKVDVNVDIKQAEFIYRDIEFNCPEKTITVIKEVPKITEVETPISWYKDHWFYAWLGTATLLIMTIWNAI